MEALTAFGLGLVTLIHPCPLSTNLSVLTLLIGLQHHSQKKVFIAGVFLLGETLAFILIGVCLVYGGVKTPVIATVLQSLTRQLIGPILILIGMMLAGILFKHQRPLGIADRFVKKSSEYGLIAGFLLGVFVAVSFCPMTAALFFGVLIPLAISKQAIVIYPVFFGLGSAIPLLAIAAVAAYGSGILRITTLKQKTRKSYSRIIGTGLIMSGIYLSLRNIYKVI